MRLGECATFINGMAFKPSDWKESGKPIIRIQNLTGTSEKFNYTDKQVEEKYIVKNGDILVSWSASIGVYEWQGEEAVLNQHIFKVKLDKIDIDKSYLKYLLTSKINEIKRKVHGATMKHITKKDFDNIEIKITDEENQKRIVFELDKIQKTIDNRKQTLNNLEELSNSLFYEKFHDLIINGEKKNLSEISEIITDGTHQTPKYEEAGIKFLSSKDVTTKRIDWSDVKFISEELHKELSKRIAPQRNDILLAKNGTTGIGAIVDTDETFDIYVSLCLIRLKKEINPKFMLYQINSDFCKAQFNKSLKGVGVPNLHLNKIRETKVIVPERDKQEEFVTTIEKIERQKEIVASDLLQLEELMDSKMHDFFS